MNDTITIENLAFGGFGVGTHQGKKVFIPYTIPGEQVAFEVTRSQKRLDWGRVVEVITPSPVRRPAPCPYFGDCGGCQWQHMEDQAQTGFKEKLFRETLDRLGGIRTDRIKPIIGAPHPFHYRSRITLHKRGGAWGFFTERSDRVVDIDNCLISAPKINEILKALREIPIRLEALQVEIAVCPSDSGAMVHIRPEKPVSAGRRKDLPRAFAGLPGIKILMVEDPRGVADRYAGGKSEPRGLRFHLPSPAGKGSALTLDFLPGVFFQVNWEQNIRLVELLLERVREIGTGLNTLELHGGAGNFTVPVAAAGHTAFSIEQNKRAVFNARKNLERNNIEGVELQAGDTAEVLKTLENSGRKFDLLITDPPRGGIKSEMESLLRLKIPHILYVSCDPATLARDLKTLEQGGYDLESAQPLDFFPQTYHIESLNYLRRR